DQTVNATTCPDSHAGQSHPGKMHRRSPRPFSPWFGWAQMLMSVLTAPPQTQDDVCQAVKVATHRSGVATMLASRDRADSVRSWPNPHERRDGLRMTTHEAAQDVADHPAMLAKAPGSYCPVRTPSRKR